MHNVKEVAKYFLGFNDEESGEMISNLKLQKLLYYAQGFSLALHGEPLFSEKIIHWKHGPVVEEIYHLYKSYGSNGIPTPSNDFNDFSEDEEELLNEVYEVYGQFSAWKLRNMTHEEDPWKNTRTNEEITNEELLEFFGDLVE